MKIEFYVSDGDDVYYTNVPANTLEAAAEYITQVKWIKAVTSGYPCIVFTHTITSIYSA